MSHLETLLQRWKTVWGGVGEGVGGLGMEEEEAVVSFSVKFKKSDVVEDMSRLTHMKKTSLTGLTWRPGTYKKKDQSGEEKSEEMQTFSLKLPFKMSFFFLH